jgi:hypothetical protein
MPIIITTFLEHAHNEIITVQNTERSIRWRRFHRTNLNIVLIPFFYKNQLFESDISKIK